MGVRSYFSDEDIEVIDKEGLKSFLKDWAIANPDWWLNEEMMKSFDDEDGFSFSSWDDLKLISYWYSIDVAFLGCVAKYIEGDVSWEFENDDESGSVRFEGGKCIIECGLMQRNNYSPKEMTEDRIGDINEKTKRLMICSNL